MQECESPRPMSVKTAQKATGYTPSDSTDGIVLAVLAFVCLAGMWLTMPIPTAPAPAPLADSDPHLAVDTALLPDNLPDKLPDIAVPDPRPAEPDAPEPTTIAPPLPTITPRILADLTPGEQIASGSGFISLMGTSYNPTNWHRSTHAATSNFLATDWTEDHAIFDADGLSLKIEHAPDRPGYFLGGEIQTSQTYGYGRYEVLMRPAKASGTVSSFFTYTGPYHGNPHDEVDIEFLGADTTKIYLNYFKGGKVGEDMTFDLPFDAADALHLYAFEWHRDGITWFVDGQPVHQTREGDPLIPKTPGSIIVNLWTGKRKLYNWHGRPDFQQTEAEYACISFQPLGSKGRSCSSIFPPARAAQPRTPGLLSRAIGELVDKFNLSQDAATRIN